MRERQGATSTRIGATATAVVLAGVMYLAGVGTQAAFGDSTEPTTAPPVIPYWPEEYDSGGGTDIDSILLKTYGVRDGSAGPDFLL
jgi:hypothetical protein